MCNKDKTPLWRRLLSGAAVCMGFTLVTLSASYGSVCILGDEGCDGDPAYTSFAEDLCIPDGKTVFECDSPAVKEKEEAGQTCTKIDGCENSCTCKEPDCQAMGYTLPGFDFEEADEYTSNGKVNAAKAIEYSDWPSNYQLDAHNDAESYACYVCTIGGKHRKQDGIYYWKCESNQICADSEDEATRIVGSRKATLQRLKSECSARTKDSSERYEYIEGTSRNNNYVCGRCVQNAENCPNGEPNTNNPSGCVLRCGDDNPRNRSTFTGESVRLATGEVVQCCYFREMDTTCTCDETLIAQYDPTKPNNAGCTGHAWNNERAEADPGAAHCTCINKPCKEGSAVVTDASGLRENAQGYWVFKRDNKCYAKKFVNWKGMEDGKDEACYKDIDMEADMSKPAGERFVEPCQEGEEFSTDTCECVPLECPEGWSIYAQTTPSIPDPKRGYLFGNNPNITFSAEALEEMSKTTAADNCGKIIPGRPYAREGWVVKYKDENDKTHRAALKNGDELVKVDGKYQVYQCGYCAPKECPKDEEDQAKNEATLDHCGAPKMIITPTEHYAGDEQCYTCPWCWDDQSVRNECYKDIIERNLVTCWSPDASMYGENQRWGDKLVPICECAGAEYYEHCYVAKESQTCSFFKYNKEEGCELVILPPGGVENGEITGRPSELVMNNGVITKQDVTLKYDHPYAISRCKYMSNSGLDYAGYTVAYVAECAAEKTCTGHGPAWNAEKKQAMIPASECQRTNKKYGSMFEGRVAVHCGGEDWYDECLEAKTCKAPTPEAQTALDACLTDSSCMITEEFDALHYSNYTGFGAGYLWDTVSGHPRLLTQKACEYEGGIGFERWYLEYCNLGGHSVSELTEVDSYEDFTSTHTCSTNIEYYVCGNSGNTMTFVFNRTSDGDTNCDEIDTSGSGVCTGYCPDEHKKTAEDGTVYCDIGYCVSSICASNEHCDQELIDGKYCPGACMKQCTGETYCDGETIVIDGVEYCKGVCKAYKCSGIASCEDALGYSGCRKNDGCVDQVVYAADADAGHGRYVAGEICTPDHEGINPVYALALCNAGTDCLGGSSPVPAGWVECNTSTHDIAVGAEFKVCGGATYYKSEDCIAKSFDEPNVQETCPTYFEGVTVSAVTTAPEGTVDTGISCTDPNGGPTLHYYVDCNSEAISIGVNGTAYTVNGLYPGYDKCGKKEDNPVTRPGADVQECNGYIYAKGSGQTSGCGEECDYNWTREKCTTTTYAGVTGVFDEDHICGGIYSQCIFDGVIVGRDDRYTEVLDNKWCTPEDPHYDVNRCGDFYNAN